MEVIHNTTSKHTLNEQKISIHALILRVDVNPNDAPGRSQRNSSKDPTRNFAKFTGILTVRSKDRLDLADLRENERNNTRSGFLSHRMSLSLK